MTHGIRIAGLARSLEAARGAGRTLRGARVLAAAVAVCAAWSAPAAYGQTPAPAQDRPVALVGGTVHTVTQGTIEGATVLLDGGRIVAVGRDVAVPAGARRVDVSGRHVYPGLIDAYNAMGLFEIGGFSQAIDLNELGAVNPNVRAEVAFNPETRHLGVARSNGVLVTVSSPAGGLISGLAAAMMLDGWTWEEMLVKRGAGLMVSWPSPMNENRYEREIRQLREAFAAARAYRTARRAEETGASARRHDRDSRWEAMIPVLDGEVPVVVGADDVRQIQDAVAWAEEEGVRLVLRGGRDAGYVADHLAAKGIPVILTAVLTSPFRAWEPYDGAYSLPRRLHEAGVPFAIAGGHSAAYANRLPYEAGAAIAFGLPEDAALRAVTLYPARFLGFEDRLGSIEPGKDATLLVTTGSPLEYATTIEAAFIEGREIDLRDAHRQFFERFSEKVRRHAPAAPATQD